MKSHRSLILSALLALLTVVSSSCRSVRPPPPDAAATGGSMSGSDGSAGRGGSGGTPGVAGSGGTSPVDMALPDVVQDMAPPIEAMPTCGSSGQPCCAGNLCNGMGCCELGVCTPHGNSCALAPSHSCLNGRCGAECGGTDSRMAKCCPQRNCTAPLTVCAGAPAPAVGSCVACGAVGQACCTGNYCMGTMTCVAGRCGGAPDAGADAPKDALRDSTPTPPRD